VTSTGGSDRLIPPERLWRLSSWLLSHSAGRAYRLVVERFGSPNVRTNYAILAGLEEFGPISQAELGRRLGVDRSDIVGVLNELEQDGLAKRAPDDHDPRRNAITITPEGARVLRELDDALKDAHEALLEPLSAQERRELNALLQRLVEYHFGAPLHSSERDEAGSSSTSEI
jgi:MarR family transcriptional regulator, lower aerobic nicotinate degradation pathway regulator